MTDEEYEDARDLAATLLAAKGLTKECVETVLNGVRWRTLTEDEKIEVIRKTMR